jgi:hypothetical protein
VELETWAAGERIRKAKEEIVVDPMTGGQKGVKESELHCLPRQSAWELGRVFKMGGLKHGDYNFRKGFAWSHLYDAAMRHATAFWDGESWNIEEFEAKDGSAQSWRVHHAIQAAWHFLILAFFDITGRGTDDRPEV